MTPRDMLDVIKPNVISWIKDSTPVSPRVNVKLSATEFAPETIDALWEAFYGRHLKVIVSCKYCNSMNARTNPTCVQCGGPMGD